MSSTTSVSNMRHAVPMLASGLGTKAYPTGTSAGNVGFARNAGRCAVVALYDELALHPKPGLVSLIDAGSHDDMHAGTFMRSLFALRHYFAAMAAQGMHHAPFTTLERHGIEAERVMLLATDNVNTHRGAIFSLGLLCAAAGSLQALGEALTARSLRLRLVGLWGQDLRDRCSRTSMSKGMRAALRHGLRSARHEAADGFPVLFEQTLPAMQSARAQGHGHERCRLQALFQTMAVLQDTNLVHRGGMSALHWAQAAARDFLAAGGATQPNAFEVAARLHLAFVARRLSPGGSADMLAAACLVDRLSTGTLGSDSKELAP
jgi:triphosphoribosyl-dephospho-CoA synthase